MKKITIILLTMCVMFLVVVLFSLTACNGNGNNNTQTITFADGETMQMRIETKDSFKVIGISDRVHTATDIWNEFRNYESQFHEYYTVPFHNVAVYERFEDDELRRLTIGAEYRGNRPNDMDLTIVEVPAALWAVFTIEGNVHETMWDAYARVNDEWGATWFEEYGFTRDENAPYLEVFAGGTYWEIWMPVVRL